MPIKSGLMEFVMSNSRRYTSSGNRNVGREKSTRVTEMRSKRDDDSQPSNQHTQIQEDSVVDACVDHAHAVARVHGAPEVMLEHLVHALARVPEAAEVLEEQGYDVDHIRRESAAIIASDIPVGKHDSKRELYASNDFTTVLHLAAANASRQGETEIAVWDLIEAISGYDDKLPAVRLLNDGVVSRDRQRTRVERQQPEPRRRERVMYDRVSEQAPIRQFASSSYGASGHSDDLMQQGLAAIETALQRQSAPQIHSDPRIDEKFERLDARMSGLVDHRDREIKELKQIIASMGVRNEDEQTKAVHADLIALREAVDRRDQTDNSSALHAEVLALREAMEHRDQVDTTSPLHAELTALREAVDRRDQTDNTSALHAELAALRETVDRREQTDNSSALHAELLALREAMERRDQVDTTSPLHAELASLREILDQRDNELRQVTAHLEQRLDSVKDDVGSLAADPQSGLRDEIRALSERIDGSGSNEVAKLSSGLDSRFVNLESAFETRQGEMLGLHSSLGKGVDEQGARLRGLEARLKGEHDETQGELRAIRGFLEKIAGTVDHYAEEIERLRLDHIGDMSVVSNQLEDIYWHVSKDGRSERASRGRSKIGGAAAGASAGHQVRPSKKSARPKKSSPQTNMGQGRGIVSNIGRRHAVQSDEDIFTYREPVEKKLVIDAETTQHVAKRFAKKSGDDGASDSNRAERGSQSYVDSDDGDITYRGQKIRRTRSSARQSSGGQSLKERLVHRGAQLKDQYRSARDIAVNTPPRDKKGWGGRFWHDVKGLFRDDDPRWTDWRK